MLLAATKIHYPLNSPVIGGSILDPLGFGVVVGFGGVKPGFGGVKLGLGGRKGGIRPGLQG